MNPDDEFREAMARDRRVRPLRRASESPVVATPSPAPVVTPAPRATPPGAPPAVPPPAPAVPPVPAEVESQEAVLARALRAEQEAHAQTRARFEALQQRHAALEAEHAARTPAGSVPNPVAAPRPSLLELLRAMGFDAPSSRFADALLALQHTGIGDRVLAGLTVAHEAEVAHLMQDKVTWRCPACASDAGAAVVVPVEPAACDVCGGSPVEAAAGRVLARCRARGYRRLLIVGGSPTYHDRLQHLLPRTDVELRLIRGDHKLGAAQAASHVRWCDRGFIWAPTILNHAVSTVFTGPHISTIPVRGIARFLLAVADRMEGEA